jgi:hypothetical protein
MPNATIDAILVRHQEQQHYLSTVRLINDEKDGLRQLWQTLSTPVYRVLADYPTEDSYEQRDSGVQCRLVEEYHVWICNDEEDGFYLAADDEVTTWALEALPA